MGPRDDELTSLDGDAGGDDGVERAESVEQYVRLHEHVEHLRADARPPQPAAMTPDEAEAYRMAALFRAAAPRADEPSPRFVSALLDRLEREASQQPAASAPAPEQPQQISSPLVVPTRAAKREVSRRALLNVGLGAAAAAAGLAVGIGIEKSQTSSATSTPTDVPLVDASAGTWVPVTAAAAVPLGGVLRFSTETIVGYVRHTDAGFTALSGVCTHMGCLLLWNGGARTFDCPCHGGRFTEDGASATGSPVVYKPLPSLSTKVEGGQVWVLVATPNTPAETTGATSTATPTGNEYGA